jgi:hypothetical protein
MTADREKLLGDTLADLAACMTTLGLYATEHPRAQAIIDKLASRLGEMLQDEAELTLVLLGEELFVQGRPVTTVIRQAPSLIRRMRRRGIEHLSFKAGVTAAELRPFLLELVGGDDVRVESRAHIAVGKVDMSEIEFGGPDDQEGGQGKRGKLPSRRDRIMFLVDAFSAVRGGGELGAGDLQRVIRAVLQDLEEEADPIPLLAEWDGAERWPAVQAYDVCVLSVGLARLAGADLPWCLDVGVAALVHDVGKLLLPAEVVARELELHGDELELMLDHPRLGFELLLASHQFPPLALIVTYEHHLNFNGTGYPRMLRPRRPHPAARLVAAANAFVTLNVLRGAHGMATRESTLAWLSSRAGSMLDPGWVTAIQELMEPDVTDPFADPGPELG